MLLTLQGFDADHRDIEILRLRSYTIGRKLSDEEVTGPGFIERVADLMRIMLPFVSHSRSNLRQSHKICGHPFELL